MSESKSTKYQGFHMRVKIFTFIKWKYSSRTIYYLELGKASRRIVREG